MTIPTKTSKSELRKKSSKAKQIDQIPEKPCKKIEAPTSTKPVPSKKVKHQPKEAEVEKVQKKKTRSSDVISISKKASLKKVNSSAELKHKSSLAPLPTKNARKKSKQTSNSTTSNVPKTAINNVKKQEKTDPHKHVVKSTADKKSSTKKLKKQSSAHILPSLPSPPPLTSTPATRLPLRQCALMATSVSVGVDMGTQTDPIVDTQLSKPTYHSHYLDVRDLVPVSALKITLEELMDSMQIVEKQSAAVPIKKQATIKSRLRKALKSIKI
ncbi:uncharacterized protein ATC70_008705 [Mucor velutinosus]|uniref:Uncharacterized protein n=1 Tax=Mucor velutinosus TaxID=708070 RepID=A0AAN7DK73_9FUNG|nr:hypothetical protein ATC70_008705 [Mucor velutinosus]